MSESRTKNLALPEVSPPSLEDYLKELSDCDAAVCEALAVGQAISERLVDDHIGYSTRVFTQMCGHALTLMRAIPHSRWVRSDFEDWHFSAVAGHVRAIMEGYLFFLYLIEPPSGMAELKAKINVMHLYDCTKRLKWFTKVGTKPHEIKSFEVQRVEICARLEQNKYFLDLPAAVQKRCLSGEKPMIHSRDQMLEAAGWDKAHFNAYWDLLSQHAHVLTMAFYRMEPNGRGTGIENEVDRGYLTVGLRSCAETMAQATKKLLDLFPDAENVCRGVESGFSPGPIKNVLVRFRAKPFIINNDPRMPKRSFLWTAIFSSLRGEVTSTIPLTYICEYRSANRFVRSP